MYNIHGSKSKATQNKYSVSPPIGYYKAHKGHARMILIFDTTPPLIANKLKWQPTMISSIYLLHLQYHSR